MVVVWRCRRSLVSDRWGVQKLMAGLAEIAGLAGDVVLRGHSEQVWELGVGVRLARVSLRHGQSMGSSTMDPAEHDNLRELRG